MPAPEGNKFAEKWTKDEALNLIDELIDFLKDNSDQYHLGGALIQIGQYPELWSRLYNKFDGVEDEVCQAIKKTETFLEARIVNSTLSGEAKAVAMAIFLLKNKYGYEDNQGMDITSNGKKLNPDVIEFVALEPE